MFCKFKVTSEVLNDFENIEVQRKFLPIGENLLKEYQRMLSESFDNYLKADGCVDAEKLSGDWFPEVKADIFISHSHANRNGAVAMAGFLNMVFGLNSFIDSTVWGNIADLQRIIDKPLYDPRKRMYDYNKRNQSTAYVHMLLSTALTKMMDNCEAMFFLSTDQSLKSQEPNITPSVWIYHELFTAKYLRQRLPVRSIVETREFSTGGVIGLEKAQEYQFDFKVQFDDFKTLGGKKFDEWCKVREKNKRTHPLDILYALYKTKRTSILRHD